MTNDLPRTEESLPISLIRAREALMGPIREMLAKAGLTEQQWRILRVLEEGGPMDARGLAQGAAISPPSLSRILTALEARSLLTRKGDPNDRRRQVVSIADAGRQVIDANRAGAQDRAQENRDRLGPEKYDQLLQLLGEISGWPDRT